MSVLGDIARLARRVTAIEAEQRLHRGGFVRLGLDLDETAVEDSPGVRHGWPSTHAEHQALLRLEAEEVTNGHDRG